MIKTKTTIGSQTIDCFFSEDYGYLYSSNLGADLLGESHQTLLDFLKIQYPNFNPVVYLDDSITYTLVPHWVIVKYISHYAINHGHKLAMGVLEDLAMGTLNARTRKAFSFAHRFN